METYSPHFPSLFEEVCEIQCRNGTRRGEEYEVVCFLKYLFKVCKVLQRMEGVIHALHNLLTEFITT